MTQFDYPYDILSELLKRLELLSGNKIQTDFFNNDVFIEASKYKRLVRSASVKPVVLGHVQDVISDADKQSSDFVATSDRIQFAFYVVGSSKSESVPPSAVALGTVDDLRRYLTGYQLESTDKYNNGFIRFVSSSFEFEEGSISVYKTIFELPITRNLYNG